jgi:syntaxin 5
LTFLAFKICYFRCVFILFYFVCYSFFSVAKTKSLFEDPTAQIQELTNVINQDIKKLNHQITQLQQLRQGRRNNQEEHHSESVVESLKHQLRGATKKFSEILEVRTEVN